MADAVFVNLLVPRMVDFKRVNSHYCKYFGANPASRCVRLHTAMLAL